ncbi:hypothetical protein CEXT_124881 [Caerostris extrusa]|uniref:Uncharacterized protein n=1 Tax=Caerostris extrusa TaxID=172846 RepID=A0AAV4S4N5_CAEEX|nr:hypothetical protein CEXT_124881 [Caerostris extrusa]
MVAIPAKYALISNAGLELKASKSHSRIAQKTLSDGKNIDISEDKADIKHAMSGMKTISHKGQRKSNSKRKKRRDIYFIAMFSILEIRYRWERESKTRAVHPATSDVRFVGLLLI